MKVAKGTPLSITVDDKAVIHGFHDFKNSLGKNMTTNMKYSLNQVAYQLFKWTNPVSTMSNAWPMKGAHAKILADVQMMFPSWEDDGWASSAFSMLKEAKGEDVAKKFWRTWKEEQYGKGRDGTVAREAGSARRYAKRHLAGKVKINPDKYAQARRSTGYQVFTRKNSSPISMVNSRSVQRRYAKLRQKRAGLAKAAYRAAISDLGTPSRTTGDRFRIIWPRQVSVPLRQFSGAKMGSSSISVDSVSVKAKGRVSSHVRYASDAITGDNWEKALTWSEKAVDYRWKTTVAAMTKHFNSQKRMIRSAA